MNLGAFWTIKLWARCPGGALPILPQGILRIVVVFLRTTTTWKPDHLGPLLQSFRHQRSKTMFPQPTLNVPLLGGTTLWNHPCSMPLKISSHRSRTSVSMSLHAPVSEELITARQPYRCPPRQTSKPIPSRYSTPGVLPLPQHWSRLSNSSTLGWDKAK